MEAERSDPDLLRALVAGEVVRARAQAADAVLAVTDRRVVVASAAKVALAVPIDEIRRIQFDIERTRPATMVIVPEHREREAQVLTIPVDQYGDAARVLVTLGLDLARAGRD